MPLKPSDRWKIDYLRLKLKEKKMAKAPIAFANPKLVFTDDGVKVCGTITVAATGQSFDVCTPEIDRAEAERAIARAWKDTKAETKRFWDRVKGWFS